MFVIIYRVLESPTTVLLKELCHDILSHFCKVQNHLQIDESLKILVNKVEKHQRGDNKPNRNKDGED